MAWVILLSHILTTLKHSETSMDRSQYHTSWKLQNTLKQISFSRQISIPVLNHSETPYSGALLQWPDWDFQRKDQRNVCWLKTQLYNHAGLQPDHNFICAGCGYFWPHAKYQQTRSLGALWAPTSSWRPFRPLDFVLRALRALRPCDPRVC